MDNPSAIVFVSWCECLCRYCHRVDDGKINVHALQT